jgi:hypothetical protein
MEAGQKFFVACAGYSSSPYAFVHEYECVGNVCGLVAYTAPWSKGRVDTIAESETYSTKDEARAACVKKLHEIRSRIVEQIDSEVQRVEDRK